MTVEATTTQIISAFGKLLNYSSNKRYGIKNKEFGEDLISKIALDIIEEIKQESGLNIMQLDNPSELLQFESIVERKLSLFTYKNLVNEETEDEIKALDHSFTLNNADIQNIDLRFKNRDKELEKRGFSQPMIRSIFKNAEFVTGIKYKIESKYYDIYFATKRHTFKNEESVILIRVGYNNVKEEFNIEEVLLFQDKQFVKLRDSPLKLLFRAIDYFGLKIDIYGQIKKFHFEKPFIAKREERKVINNVISPQTYSVDLGFIKILDGQGTGFQAAFGMTVNDVNSKVYFVYAINKKAYEIYLKEIS